MASSAHSLSARGSSAAAAVLALGLASAYGQTPTDSPAAPPAAERLDEQAAEKAARESELKALEETLGANKEARARLDAEIDAIKSDRAALNAALIDTTGRVRAAEERIAAAEARLEILGDSAAAIRASLESRRAVIVEVLAALQRMGRRPPPAVLVRPEDMLDAVRTSILLGAVIPELRSEAETLAGDLTELVRLSEASAAERKGRLAELRTLVGERERLASLVEARQQRLALVEKNVGSDNALAAELAAQAQGLRELIHRMETEIASGRRVAEEAVRAADAAREKLAALAFKDPARLAPKVAFAEAKGLLPMPVGGALVRSFGAPDGFGTKSQGISITARPGAVVSSPTDGWISFAGPFRSFGQLLIINAGSGYYILLAGMERINVGLGQFVLAGEPVAVMGEAAASSAAFGGASGAALYVEFRKDGGSIDPGPWWVRAPGG